MCATTALVIKDDYMKLLYHSVSICMTISQYKLTIFGRFGYNLWNACDN